MTTPADVLTLGRSIKLTTRVLAPWVQASTPDQLDYLAGLLSAEVDSRAASHRARLLHRAHLPQRKTLQDYQWDNVTLPNGLTPQDITSLDFITTHQDLICIGDVGTGKTHLALALAQHACMHAIETRFYTVSSLAMLLRRAKQEDRLDRQLADLARPKLLILDELGYLPIDTDGGRLLFQVITQAYETQSLIITTNLDLSAWGNVFGDDNLAAAIIDRLIHHGRLLRFTGQSYRLAHALLTTTDETAQKPSNTAGITTTKRPTTP